MIDIREPQKPDDAIRRQLTRSETLRRSLEADNRSLRNTLASRDEMVQEVIAAVEPVPAIAQPPMVRRKGRPRATLVLALADWHLGEVVRAEEMGGVNAYNWTIAREGMLDIVRRVCTFADNQRHSANINEVCILTLGDLVSGEIHPELAATNEFRTPVAVARAASLLTEVYGTLATKFRRVRALQVGAGNHDRTDPKPPSKRAVEGSYSTLYHAMSNAQMANCKGFVAETPEDTTPTFDINGHAIVATHGDAIKMSTRTPYYGLREFFNGLSQSAVNAGRKPVSMAAIGHFHRYAVTEDGRMLLCPSLMGLNEWARRQGYRGRPGQVAWMMGDHGPYGMTVFERRTGR